MLLGISTYTTKYICHIGLFIGKVVSVDSEFAIDLDLPAVKGWVLAVRKQRWVRDLCRLS